MKRFHVSVAVADLERSRRFYSTLFGAEPAVLEDDYAKWMLEDPRLNFSISTGGASRGISHLGLQADTIKELEAIRARLQAAAHDTHDQNEAECCYALSTKTWVRDPDDVTWETFVTHGESSSYGKDRMPGDASRAKQGAACCEAESRASGCI